MKKTLSVAAAILIAACDPSSLVETEAPSTWVDVTNLETPAGAVGLFNNANLSFLRALSSGGGLPWTSYIGASGLFSDELANGRSSDAVHQRNIAPPPGNPGAGNATNSLNLAVHNARNNAVIARIALLRYHPTAPDSMVARMYVNEGFTTLMLAEAWCSGTPLSQVDFDGKSKPSAGLTTDEIFIRAEALFDSALAFTADPALEAVARVGKARALLGRGQFAEAAAAVATVNTQFVYSVSFGLNTHNNDLGRANNTLFRAQDNEGTNGLVWSTDPRTAIQTRPTAAGSMLWALKYNVTPAGVLDATVANPTAPVRVADGLEARLIEAEAALQANNPSWLTTLNSLRSTCIGTAACAPVPGLTTGNLPANLTDPGTAATRLDLLMRERAMWLYMTGHRLGDMRRLARIHQRDPDTIWPTGTILAPAFPPAIPNPLPENGILYGTHYVFVPHSDEQGANPFYSGCHDLNP